MKIEDARKLPENTWVVYAPAHGPREDGNIVRCTDTMVFVRYRGDTHAKATRPEDLILPFEPRPTGELVYVDDERPIPESGWYLAKDSERAIVLLQNMTVRVLSLDYSLSMRTKAGEDEPDNGGRVLQWLSEHPDRWPTEEIIAHSSSASGRGLIVKMAEDLAPPGWTGKITDLGGF